MTYIYNVSSMYHHHHHQLLLSAPNAKEPNKELLLIYLFLWTPLCSSGADYVLLLFIFIFSIFLFYFFIHRSFSETTRPIFKNVSGIVFSGKVLNIPVVLKLF